MEGNDSVEWIGHVVKLPPFDPLKCNTLEQLDWASDTDNKSCMIHLRHITIRIANASVLSLGLEIVSQRLCLSDSDCVWTR